MRWTNNMVDAAIATAVEVGKAQWDKWYANLPEDLRRKLSPYDFKRLGDCFKTSFGILNGTLMRARLLVAEQANDDGLWFIAQTAPEGYLQQELRRLHRVIEDKHDPIS